MGMVKLHFPADKDTKDSKLTDIAVISLAIWGLAVLFGLVVLGWFIRQKMSSQP
jgi:hypothetical protein